MYIRIEGNAMFTIKPIMDQKTAPIVTSEISTAIMNAMRNFVDTRVEHRLKNEHVTHEELVRKLKFLNKNVKQKKRILVRNKDPTYRTMHDGQR